MKKTSQRSLLFRQNVGRTEEEWAHFLDGYRQALSLRLASTPGRGGRSGDEGLRKRTADIFAKHGEIAAKMKSAPGPGPSDFRLHRRRERQDGSEALALGWLPPPPQAISLRDRSAVDAMPARIIVAQYAGTVG